MSREGIPLESCGEADSFRTLGQHFRTDQAHVDDGILNRVSMHEQENEKVFGTFLQHDQFSMKNIIVGMKQAELTELHKKTDFVFPVGPFTTNQSLETKQSFEDVWSHQNQKLQSNEHTWNDSALRFNIPANDNVLQEESNVQSNYGSTLGNLDTWNVAHAFQNVSISDNVHAHGGQQLYFPTQFVPFSMESNFSENLFEAESSELDTVNTADTSNTVENEVRKSASELVNTVNDSDLNETEFMTFMKNLESGAATIESGKVYGEPFAKFDRVSNTNTLDKPSTSSVSKENDSFWDKFKEGFSKNFPNTWGDQELPYMRDPFDEYEFNDSNPMKDNKNALEEGKRRLLAGDLPSAVLCFEAAVQMEPENTEAWLLLGTTNAENEQDPAAIPALKKCISLDEGNLTALMALAVCYTNEDLDFHACESLKKWLQHNPNYSGIVNDKNVTNASIHRTEFGFIKEVESLFIEAARKNPGENLDPDVQACLGVLYNLSNEHNKAVDCFKAALSVKDKDARLWNRLGATLANGNRSEEAVYAYRQALSLSPGFVRARYNMGVTCVNLTAYKEAAEHFLSALNQQAIRYDLDGNRSNAVMSKSIWSALKMVMAMLDRQDLYEAVENQDLQRLNSEFGLS